MQLPLQISHDTLIKKKSSCSNLHWIGENTEYAFSVGAHHVSKIQLSTGNATRVSKLSSVLKEVVAINITYDGSYIYGMLCSGDLFFWNHKDNSLNHARGIPELVTHLPNESTEHNGPLQAIYAAFRQTQNQNSEQDEEDPNVQPHLKPKIFASLECSTVIVILGSMQVYLWERHQNIHANDKDYNISGSWSVVPSPSDIPMPSLQSKESQISVCFPSDEVFRKQCFVTFSFIDGASFMATTLTLQWGRTQAENSFATVASAFWNNISVLFNKMGIEEEMCQRYGILVSKYAHNQSLMCTAVNSSQYPVSKLVYLHPLCKTTLIISVGKVNGHFSSLTRSHWVSDLSWSRDNSYLVGCLQSGSVFMATRMGTLLTIFCPGMPVKLQPSILLPLHSTPVSLQKEAPDEDEEAPNTSFHVSFHPQKDMLLMSSAVRVSVLTLPENGARDAEIADQLLVSANHALYILSNSALTHDYAYIHCSNWRLARSVADLTQNGIGMKEKNKYEIKLFEAESICLEEGEQQETMPVSEGEQLIKNVIDPLLAAWTIILTHKKPQLQEWRERAKNVANLVVKLVKSLMQASADDDQSEHQAQLLQMLQLFHCFMRVLDLWPNSLHMLKPSLWMTHHIMHTLLQCEKHAGESSMVDTLLILSQTLSCVEKTFTYIFSFQPALTYAKGSVYGSLEPMAGAEVTNIKVIATGNARESLSGSSLMAFKIKNLWLCLYKSARKLYLRIQEQKYNEKLYGKAVLTLNIVQSNLVRYNYSLHSNVNHFRGGHKLYLNGMISSAVEEWKSDILAILLKKEKKKVGKRLHSILYSLILTCNFVAISCFLSWIYGILKSDYFTLYKVQSSHVEDRLCSTPKPKKNVDKITPKIKDLELSRIILDSIKKEGIPIGEKSIDVHSVEQNQYDDVKPDSGLYICEKRQRAFVTAVRKLIGSIGRIMMGVILHKNVVIPSPNNPHIIQPSWTTPDETKDTGAEVLYAEVSKRAIHEAEWSSKTAAQALAIAGYWIDLTALAHELGDTRTALVASLISTSDIQANEMRNHMPESLHPSSLINSCILGIDPQQEITSSIFYSCHELFQLASMVKLDILPGIMLHCLNKIKEAVNCLEFKVQLDIYLPAPPVFCPQLFGGEDDCDKSMHEKQLRREIAGWVQLFSTVVSASGIAQPLLQEMLKHEPDDEVEMKHHHELLCLSDILGPTKSSTDMKKVSEWSRLFQLWADFLRQLWILEVRDKLWLCLRKYDANSSPQHKKKNTHENNIVEILLLLEKLHKLSESNTWKKDIVAIALAIANNAPPCPAVAEALAKTILQPSALPSLIRDRANRLFDVWRKTLVNRKEFDDANVKAKKKLFPENIKTDLYSIFEDACTEALQKNADQLKTENELHDTDICADTMVTLFESPSGEFRKLLTLYANMTFRKDAENFPQHFAQVPNLPEFSKIIKKRELQCLNLKKSLAGREIIEATFDFSDSGRTSSNIREKKGFFRNVNILQRDENVTLIVRSKENRHGLFRSQSFSPDRRNISYRSNSLPRNLSGSSDMQPKKHERSRRLRQNASNRRRHHSFSSYKRERSVFLCKRSNSLCTLDSKNASNSLLSKDVSAEVPLNLFLLLNEHLALSIKNKDFQNNINLLFWILRRERKFCLSSIAHSDGKGSILKKVDLSIQDFILAFAWDFIKEMKPRKIDGPPQKKSNHSKVANPVPCTKSRDEQAGLPHKKSKRSKVADAVPHKKSRDEQVLVDAEADTPGFKELHAENGVNSDRKETPVALLPSKENTKAKETENEVDKGPNANESEKSNHEFEEIPNKFAGAVANQLTDHYQTKTERYPADEQDHIQIPDGLHLEEVASIPEERSNKQSVVSNGQNDHLLANHSEIGHSSNNKRDVHKETRDNKEFEEKKIQVPDHVDGKLPTEKRNVQHDFVDASTQYSVPLSENSWKPFRPKSRMSRKPPPPRLVIEAENDSTKKQEKPTAVIKKKSLTPVETPSEILESPFHGVPKLLQHEFDKQEESRVLSLSDLDDDVDDTCVSQSLALPNDNTLDDVTLPDSLHVSDLEENDLQYKSSSVRKNEMEKLTRIKAQNEEKRMNATITLSHPTRITTNHEKQSGRAAPIQVKPIHLQSENAIQKHKHANQPTTAPGKIQILKLLTLPKSEPTEYSEDKSEKYQPLILKKIPFLPNKHFADKKITMTKTSEYHTENASKQRKKSRTVKFVSEPSNYTDKPRMPLLEVPLFAPTQKASREKKQLKLLDPHKIFTLPKGDFQNKKFIQIRDPNTRMESMSHLTIKIKQETVATGERVEKFNKLVPESKSNSVLRIQKETSETLFADKQCETEDSILASIPTVQKTDRACQHIFRPPLTSTETQTSNDVQTLKAPEITSPVLHDNIQKICKQVDIGTNKTVNSQIVGQPQTHDGVPKVSKTCPESSDAMLEDKVKKSEIETKPSERSSQDNENICEQKEKQTFVPSHSNHQKDIQSQKKNSHTQTHAETAYSTSCIEKGVQTQTREAAADQQIHPRKTYELQPERSSQAALVLNSPSITVDKPKPQPISDNFTNVLTEVDIPQDIVQGHLNAISDKLNQTIHSEDLKLPVERAPSLNRATSSELVKCEEVTEAEPKPIDIIPKMNVSHDLVLPNTNVVFDDLKDLETRKQHRDFVQLKDSIEGNSLGPVYSNKAVSKSEPSKEQEYDDDRMQDNIVNDRDAIIEDPLQAFCEAKITFEELCKHSTQIVTADKNTENLPFEKTNHVEAIQALEREAEDALQGLHESKHFMSRINVLVDTAAALESERGERILLQTSVKQNTSRKSTSTKSKEWQSTKALLCKTGDSDILLKYLEEAQPKDLTFDVIDDIIKYAGLEDPKKESSSITTPLMGTYTLQNVSSNQDLNMNENLISYDRPSASEGTSELYNEQQSPILHLDLASFRSDFGNTYIPQKTQLSTLSREGEELEKRKKIRKWMNEQRQKRRAQALAAHKETKPRGRDLNRGSATLCKKSTPSKSTTIPSGTLTSREIRERSKERDERRAELRKDLQRKREEEVEKLLAEHEEEVQTYRDLTKKKKGCFDRMGRSVPRVNDGPFGHKPKNKTVKLNQGNITVRTPSSATKRKAELALAHKSSFPKENMHQKTKQCVKPNVTLENDKTLQEEIDQLRECVRSAKSREHSVQLIEDKTKRKNTKASSHNMEEDTGQKHNKGNAKHLKRNGSFSLSLDRISEVDSSSQSLLNVQESHNVEEDTNEDTSGDISWNVPDEIKMLLYK